MVSRATIGFNHAQAYRCNRGQAVQAAVTAIRKAGATSNLILLPGTQYTSASGFQTQSAPALSTVKDSDGSTSKLIYDVHQYFDNGSGGKSKEARLRAIQQRGVC